MILPEPQGNISYTALAVPLIYVLGGIYTSILLLEVTVEEYKTVDSRLNMVRIIIITGIHNYSMFMHMQVTTQRVTFLPHEM